MNVWSYIAVFAAAAALMLIMMPHLLRYLRKKKMGQTIYDKGPQAHLGKQGTPNMGGLLIGGITVVVLLIYSVVTASIGKFTYPFFSLDNPLFALLFITVGSMAIGFADDYIKDVKKRHEGLTPKQKIIMQFVLGLLFSLYCYFYKGSGVWLLFTGHTWYLGLLYIPIMILLVIFMTNSSNLQDGVDGLLSTVTLAGMPAFALIAILSKDDPHYAVLAIALSGCCAGFLFFNAHPAKIFMGDTGSMFIGGAMVGLAMSMRIQFLLLLICFTCVMSSVSVMMQTAYFKLTHGKRIFRMSPIHHHFELGGMTENQIVLMYLIVTLVLSAIAVWSVSFLY